MPIALCIVDGCAQSPLVELVFVLVDGTVMLTDHDHGLCAACLWIFLSSLKVAFLSNLLDDLDTLLKSSRLLD